MTKYDFDEEIKKLMEVLPDKTEDEIRQGIIDLQDDEEIDQYPALLAYRNKTQNEMSFGMTDYHGRVLYKGEPFDVSDGKHTLQNAWVYFMEEGSYYFAGSSLWNEDIDNEKGLNLVPGDTFQLKGKPQEDRWMGLKIGRVRDVINTGNDDTIPGIWDLELLPLGKIYDVIDPDVNIYDMFEGMVVDFIYTRDKDHIPNNIVGVKISHESNPVPINCMFVTEYGNMPGEMVKYVRDNLRKYKKIRVFGNISGTPQNKDATIYTDAIFFPPVDEEE